MNRHRLPWIDYAKVFSICLVVSYHTPPRPEGFGAEVVSMLRMPAFFLIAGFLFKSEKFESLKAFLLHRGRQLLVPYFAFSLVFYLLWLAFGRDLAGDQASAFAPILQQLSGRPQLIVAPFWFIACLFTLQTLYYLLQRIVPRKWLFATCMLMPLIPAVTEVTHIWQLLDALLYLPFYAFANCFKDLIASVSFRSHRKLIGITLPIALTLIYMRAYHTADLPPGTAKDLLRYALLVCGGLLLLPSYISLCKAIASWIGAKSWVETIGKNTIIILALQNYCIGIIKILADRISGTPQYLEGVPGLNPLLTILVILILYLPIQVIDRWMPFLSGHPSSPRQEKSQPSALHPQGDKQES